MASASLVQKFVLLKDVNTLVKMVLKECAHSDIHAKVHSILGGCSEL